jgi:predicted nucleic acid-binding protein
MPDVNVLIDAHRAESPDREEVGAWLRAVLDGPEPVALSEPVLSGFLRVDTDRRVFEPPMA